ncbi:redoxin domain-containing protein [Paenibacillus sp. KN14-4R]|uniref:redoxin domain-containing protein n=1 Tax=Paenibacillus sp. KN14-4R TaxID=3445773 RepID=UPI003FA04348
MSRTKSQRWRNWGICGIILIALTYTLITTSVRHSDTSIHVGQLAPDIRVTDMNGRAVNLSDYKGKGVLLNFWGSWCGSCVSEMSLLKEAYESGMDGIEVLAVNVGESKGTIMEFSRTHQLPFPIMTDPSGDSAAAFQVKGLPATVLVTAQGVVKQFIPGEFTNTEQIKSLMKSVQPEM